MKYKFCEQIQKSIFFDRDSVSHCCNCDKERNTFFLEKYNGEIIDWQNIIAEKRKIQELAKNNITYFDACKHCHMWKEYEWEDVKYLGEFVITHWTACNCNCYYCYTAEDKKGYNSFKNYNLIPVLEDLFNSDFYNRNDRDNNIVRFLGGDVADLDNFEELINLFIKNSVNNFYIPTSGIKYLPVIEKILSECHAEVIVSLDCGNAELFQKIKRINAFDEVVSNIKKYAAAAKERQSEFIVKYIILPYVNDSIKDINQFLKLCVKSKVNHIAQDVEENFMAKFSVQIPPHIPELLKYIDSKASMLGLKITNFRYATQLLYEIQNGSAKLAIDDKCKNQQITFTRQLLCR